MKNYFEDFVDEYADEIVAIQPEFYKNAAKKIDGVLAGLSKDSIVLDIGNGGVINYDITPISKLVCADLSVSAKAIERYKDIPQISFCEGNMMDLNNFATESFDAVIVQTVIHHLAGSTLAQTEDNVEQGIRECMRVLKWGGELLIVESTVVPWFEKIERLLYGLMQLFFKIIHFDTVYQYSAKSLLKKLERMKLNVVETDEVKTDKYIWICRKKILSAITPCRAQWILIKK